MKKFITRINGFCDSQLKEKQDKVFTIANRSGWLDMALYVYSNESESAKSKSARFDGIIAGISPGDIVFFQLPTGNGHRWEQELISRVKAYGGRVAVYIHAMDYSFNGFVDSEEDTIFVCKYQNAIVVDSFQVRERLVLRGINRNKIFVREESNEWFDETYYIPKTLDLACEYAFLEDKCNYLLVQKDIERGNDTNRFTFYTARASYGGKNAITFNYIGEADAIIIKSGDKTVWQTNNVKEHYAIVQEGLNYSIHAVVYTQTGRVTIASTNSFSVTKPNYNIEKPKISLIIPMYNSSRFIVRTIDSVLGQSQDDIEIVLVDDESTDSTVEIVDWYRQEFNSINLIQKKNGGQGSARNVGIDFAHGQYITFMDHDDILPPDSQKALYDLITSTNTDIGIGNTVNILADEDRRTVYYSWKECEVYDAETYMDTHSPVMIWNKIYKADLCKGIHFVPRHHEDISWSPIIFSYANSISLTSEVVYEWDRTSITQSVDNLSRTEEWFTETYCIAVNDALTRGNPKRMGYVKKMVLSCEAFNYHPGLYDAVKKMMEDKE